MVRAGRHFRRGTFTRRTRTPAFDTTAAIVSANQFGGSFSRVRDTAIITPTPATIRQMMAT